MNAKPKPLPTPPPLTRDDLPEPWRYVLHPTAGPK